MPVRASLTRTGIKHNRRNQKDSEALALSKFQLPDFQPIELMPGDIQKLLL